MADPFAEHRDDLLEQAEAAGWPELVEPGRVCIVGELEWRAALEAATGGELILMLASLTRIGTDDNEREEEEAQ